MRERLSARVFDERERLSARVFDERERLSARVFDERERLSARRMCFCVDVDRGYALGMRPNDQELKLRV